MQKIKMIKTKGKIKKKTYPQNKFGFELKRFLFNKKIKKIPRLLKIF